MKSVFRFALPSRSLLFIGLTGGIVSPAPSFPSARANPLNQMKDTGFVQSLESGGKRFVLLAGSNRRNLAFRERASLVVKVQSNRALIGPFVGVAEEICHENSLIPLARRGQLGPRPTIFIHNGAPQALVGCLGQSASGPIRPAQNDGVRVTTQNRSTGRANTYPTPRSVWMICGALGSCSSLRRGGEIPGRRYCDRRRPRGPASPAEGAHGLVDNKRAPGPAAVEASQRRRARANSATKSL